MCEERREGGKREKAHYKPTISSAVDEEVVNIREIPSPTQHRGHLPVTSYRGLNV